MQRLGFPEMDSLDPMLDTKIGTTAMILAAALSSKVGLCGLKSQQSYLCLAPGWAILQGYTGLGHSSRHPQGQRLCSSSLHWGTGSSAVSGNLLSAHIPSLGR